MSVKDGLDAVDPIVRKYSKGGRIDSAVLGPHAAVVMERAAKEGLVFEASGHERYDKDSNEIHMWWFGLMLCEYVAGLLERKARQGHCMVHRLEPELKRCPPTGKLHREMLEEFSRVLNGLVGETNSKIAHLKRDFPEDG